jgi:hypothetical protein
MRDNGPPIVNHNRAAVVYKGDANRRGRGPGTGDGRPAGGE